MTFNVQGAGSNELQGVPTRPRDFGVDANVPVDDVEYDVWDARGPSLGSGSGLHRKAGSRAKFESTRP